MTRAVILFGHGSRDPLWRQPMDAVAGRIAATGVAVRCAFLELQAPDLAAAASELIAEGATRLSVVPMFLGAGRHAREDLPRLAEEVRCGHPGVNLELRPPVGEDPRVLDLLAAISRE
jgi:sirohydrochlorin cobaltochelatase